ncbi:MAG: PD-(D/E)XK nuclease family protein [Actinomycetaceae bacterium]|nr:PD-(D/E)XK nuclease family protein [Actinomycetaceae bacterium]
MSFDAPRPRKSFTPAFSASRAADFKQCPLKFRLRTVDKIPEPPSLAALKGTLVHAVLEKMFTLPAAQREAGQVLLLLPESWVELREKNLAHPDSPLGKDFNEDTFIDEAKDLLRSYFEIENPQHLNPAQTELMVEAQTDYGLNLRGIIDRIEVAPDGRIRVVDYKSGKAPHPNYTQDALFQMRFYALLLWRAKNTLPARMQLLYLKDRKVLTFDPQAQDIESFGTQLQTLWQEVENCANTGVFRPRRSRLCDWCYFQAQCPLFGGQTPEAPVDGMSRLKAMRTT